MNPSINHTSHSSVIIKKKETDKTNQATETYIKTTIKLIHFFFAFLPHFHLNIGDASTSGETSDGKKGTRVGKGLADLISKQNARKRKRIAAEEDAKKRQEMENTGHAK